MNTSSNILEAPARSAAACSKTTPAPKWEAASYARWVCGGLGGCVWGVYGPNQWGAATIDQLGQGATKAASHFSWAQFGAHDHNKHIIWSLQGRHH